MRKFKLINYTTQDFVSEKILELKSFRWNKEGVNRLGHLFEYEDDKAYQKCQTIFQEIERNEKEDN